MILLAPPNGERFPPMNSCIAPMNQDAIFLPGRGNRFSLSPGEQRQRPWRVRVSVKLIVPRAFTRIEARYYPRLTQPVHGKRTEVRGQPPGSIPFYGSTGSEARSMYVFMVSVSLMSFAWGVSPTTCGSAPFTQRNPRLLRRADTFFAFITSHTV